MKIVLNSAQKDVVQEILFSFKNKNNFLLSWYTGSGKTNVFLEVIKEITEKNPKAIVGVSCYLQRNIKMQTVERADKHYNFKHHMVNSFKEIDPKSKILFFNPQVFFKKENKNNLKFDYLIIDEAHVGLGETANFYNYLIKNFCHEKTRYLLASATPWDILNNPLAKEANISIRSMDTGIQEDKFLTNFKINIENINLDLKRDDFSRNGDIKDTYLKKNFELFKKITIEKAQSIIKKKSLGSKVLIVVPPGNKCQIASELAGLIGKSALCLIQKGEGRVSWQDTEANIINEFKYNPNIRFLIVVNKCQLGFDMPNLTSTIDLTMTRNVKLLIQRWGRLARRDRSQELEKKYFYVIDNHMSADEAEWVLGTSIEYAMGKWLESHNAENNIFRRKTKLFDITNKLQKREFSLEDLILVYKGQTHKTHREFSFIENSKEANYWTKNLLVKEAKKYKNRTEFSEKCRYLYRKLKKDHPDELNKIFPYVRKLSWSKEELYNETKSFKSRRQFLRKFRGMKFAIEVANDVFGKPQPQTKITLKMVLENLKGHKPTRLRQVRSILGERSENVLRENGFNSKILLKTLNKLDENI